VLVFSNSNSSSSFFVFVFFFVFFFFFSPRGAGCFGDKSPSFLLSLGFCARFCPLKVFSATDFEKEETIYIVK
jgi:hypothetical protein